MSSLVPNRHRKLRSRPRPLPPQPQQPAPPAFLGRTSVVVAIVVSSLGVSFTGIGVYLDYLEKTEPKPVEKVVEPTYSCPEERMKALQLRDAYPNMNQKYTGPIQYQCQLNEVVADAAALPPAAKGP